MMIGSRSTTSVAIEVIRALLICKRCMDTATTRKRGSTRTLSRSVCVISLRILRSGVRRKSHAPFWSSGRRSDPPTDCNQEEVQGLLGALLALVDPHRRYATDPHNRNVIPADE